MTGVEAALLELVALAETPVYSAYSWLGREFGRRPQLEQFLQLIDYLVAQDRIRLWHVDVDSARRARLDSVPVDVRERYRMCSEHDPAYDPFGLSLTLGDVADLHEEPAWQIDFDFAQARFELRVASGDERVAIEQVGAYFPDVELVARERVHERAVLRVVGRLATKPGS